MSADILEKPDVNTARWRATIFYRSELGIIDVQHGIEEIADLHDIVERGPHWDTIDHIHIVIDRKAFEELTIEEATRV